MFGPGLNSRVLAPFVKSIVGVDISQEMVDRYNKRVENQGIPREEMRAICIPEQLLTHVNDLRLAKLLGDIEFDVAIVRFLFLPLGIVFKIYFSAACLITTFLPYIPLHARSHHSSNLADTYILRMSNLSQ